MEQPALPPVLHLSPTLALAAHFLQAQQARAAGLEQQLMEASQASQRAQQEAEHSAAALLAASAVQAALRAELEVGRVGVETRHRAFSVLYEGGGWAHGRPWLKALHGVP